MSPDWDEEQHRHETAKLWPQQARHSGGAWGMKRLWMTQIKPGHKPPLELRLSVVCLSRAPARWRDGRYDQLNNFIKLHTVTLGQNQK